MTSSFITLDAVNKLKSDYSFLVDTIKDLKVLVHKHDTSIQHKLVDHYLLKETIKNYLHDFEIQLRNSTTNEIALLKEVMWDKMGRIEE